MNHGALKALISVFTSVCGAYSGKVGGGTYSAVELKRGTRSSISAHIAYLGYQKPFCYRLADEQHQQEPSRRNNCKHESMHHLRHLRTVPTK